MYPREQKIIIVLKGEKITEGFVKLLFKQCNDLNAKCKCERMDISDARLVISAARERVINLENKNQRFNRLIQSANDTSVDRSKSLNPSPVSATGRYNSRYAPTTSSVVTGRSPLRNRSTRASLPITPIVQTVIDLDDDEDVSADQTVDHSLESIKSSVIFTYPKDEPNAIQIVGNDMLCLNKGEFLNDNIVNFYLRHYYKEVLDEEMAKRCHIFDTLFFMQLTEKRGPKRKNPSLPQSDDPYTFDQRYEKKLKNWTKNVDLFSKDFLVFPIIRESHWFVAIVCYPSLVLDTVSTLKTCDDKKPITEFDAEAKESRKACILFMDSLGNASYKKPLSEPIRDFLTYEWKAKKGSDVIAFKNRNKFRDYAPKVPVQTNSSDCGLFVLEYIKEFLKSPDDLAPKLMDYRKGLKKWFASEGIKANRAAIRLLVLQRVANETIRQSLEDMIDDSKDSDDDDDEERDKSTKDGETTAATEDEDQVEGVPPDELGMEVDKCCGTDSRPPSPPTPSHRPDRAEARDSESREREREVSGGDGHHKSATALPVSDRWPRVITQFMVSDSDVEPKKPSILGNKAVKRFFGSTSLSLTMNWVITRGQRSLTGKAVALLWCPSPPLTSRSVTTSSQSPPPPWEPSAGDTSQSSSSMSCWQLNAYAKSFSTDTTLTLNADRQRPVIHRASEVMVRVLASSVNPLDVWMSTGYGRSILDAIQLANDLGIAAITHDRLPLILGRDFCGQIVRCGHGVRYRPGDVVWGALPPHWRTGAHSQYIVADESHLCLKPDNLSPTEAAAIPYVGLTAWSAISTIGGLDHRNAFNKRALVLGGSGGVGTFAIQLLKAWGAHVTTTCSADATDFVYDQTGADLCVDYNDANELNANCAESFDFVLNAASAAPDSATADTGTQYLRKWKCGTYVTLTTPLLANADRYGLVLGTGLSALTAVRQTVNNALVDGRSARWAYYMPDRRALEAIAQLARQSLVKPVIEKTYAFNDLPLAYRRVADGHSRGKTALEFT
ncbi:unnamed protein product [Medioppia subpectinata]|uniref:Ubiquitin-like protease family profile domain-containing protein n=1 Tax=Medioppia subpectinata TaxID=1979941 RepID=A0A7R9Q1Y9_9ACAR|nr:unnamed protein product [Medioppia subpectinata]CAG2109746.1 unnamed protein product [Medioppia subpectinata]